MLAAEKKAPASSRALAMYTHMDIVARSGRHDAHVFTIDILLKQAYVSSASSKTFCAMARYSEFRSTGWRCGW